MTTPNNEPVHRFSWQFILLFILLVASVGITAGSYIYILSSNELTYSLHFLVFLEAVSTASALLLIWTTINEGRIDRQAMLNEARADRALQQDESAKERRKERLREQLKFYSPIVGRVRRKDYETENKPGLISEILDSHNGTYELYTEPKTKRLLREYYSGEIKTFDEFSKYGEDLRTVVLVEFSLLREEYLSLVKVP
jgi:hypothetical protein